MAQLEPGQLHWVGRSVVMPDGLIQYIQPYGKGDSPCCYRWINPNRIRPSLINQICLSALAADNPAERWADPGDLEVALALISTEPQLKAVVDAICATPENGTFRQWRTEAQTYLLRNTDLQRHQEDLTFAAALNKASC